MSLEYMKKSLYKAPIVKKGDYYYVIHPITDGIPEIKPKLLEEVSYEMKKIIEKYGEIDKILTIEAMGIPLATILSLKMNIPLTIIRKRQYNFYNEISIEQTTGYSKSKLYLNGINKGDKIIIVDDVISTGGTLRAVLKSLKNIGAIVKCVIIAIDKGKSAKKIMYKTKIPIHTIVDIEMNKDKLIIRKM